MVGQCLSHIMISIHNWQIIGDQINECKNLRNTDRKRPLAASQLLPTFCLPSLRTAELPPVCGELCEPGLPATILEGKIHDVQMLLKISS